MKITEAQAKVLLGKHYKKPRDTGIKRSKKPSEGEKTLSLELAAAGIEFEREFKFHDKRKWRADFRISNTKILVEVEGGVWTNGRHTRGTGYTADAEKYSTAASEGWIVLRFTTEQVKAGKAIGLIKKCISQNNSMEQV